MPTKSSLELKNFLLTLAEKPNVLNQFKKNPSGLIVKSKLAKSHQKILLGGNVYKIKDLIAKVIDQPESAIHIVADPAIKLKKKASASAIHFVLGTSKSPIKFSLKSNVLKPKQHAIRVIHIIAKPNI